MVGQARRVHEFPHFPRLRICRDTAPISHRKRAVGLLRSISRSRLRRNRREVREADTEGRSDTQLRVQGAPPCCSTIFLQIAGPSPVPSYADRSARWKTSKIRWGDPLRCRCRCRAPPSPRHLPGPPRRGGCAVGDPARGTRWRCRGDSGTAAAAGPRRPILTAALRR